MSGSSDLIVAVPLYDSGNFKICALKSNTTSSDEKKEFLSTSTKSNVPNRRINIVAVHQSGTVSKGRVPITIK